MPETNGNQDNVSRLDRIEIAIEHMINEHEKFEDEHRRLLAAQIVMVANIDKLTAKVTTADEAAAVVDERVGAMDARSVTIDERLTAADEWLGRRINEVDERLGKQIAELGARIDAFRDVSERNSREYHERLNRLENRQ